MPRTLSETYASILERIDRRDWELARNAFFWLAFAYRPLRLAELNEAVVIDETCTALEDDMMLVAPEILLHMCQGLITQDSKTGEVVLAHSSIKDFLTSDWIRSSGLRFFSLDPSTANHTIMRQCLTYLCLDNFRSGYRVHHDKDPFARIDQVRRRVRQHPFLAYAAEFWGQHGASCTFQELRDRQLLDQFFASRLHLSRCGNFGAWVQVLIPEASPSTIEATSPLYYASSFNMLPVARFLVERDPALINAPGGRRSSTPLFIACFRGHVKMAEMLIEAGGDPTIRDPGIGITVFQLVDREGHVAHAALRRILSKYR